MATSLIIGAAAFIVVVCLIGGYNKGIQLKNYVKEAFSTMDVFLKKRWDLVPNLIETVKGYAAHEKEIFEKVTKLRNQNYTGMNSEQKMNINSELGQALSKLIAVAENYPDLKANENFKMLMTQLTSIEEDIANSRKYYNASVRELNNYTEMFPTNIIAGVFGIRPEKMFEIDESQRANVKVSF